MALVDWADEEGARFGRSLLGSSAFAGTLDLRRGARARRTPTACRCPTRSPRTASTFDAMASAGEGRRDALCRLPRAAHRAGAGAGGRGPAVRRRARDGRRRAPPGVLQRPRRRTPARRRWTAAPTPAWPRRARSPGSQEIGARARRGVHGGPARPRAGHRDRRAGPRRRCSSTSATSTRRAGGDARRRAGAVGARRRPRRAARSTAERDLGDRARSRSTTGWSRRPREACRAAAGSDRALPSGALHDASELARVVPAAMIFSSSNGRRQPRAGGGHARGRPRRMRWRPSAALAERVVAEGVPGSTGKALSLPVRRGFTQDSPL